MANRAFTVQVAIKAFEKRYLDQASHTISDLMFVTVAPKGGGMGNPSTTPSALLSPPANASAEPVDWKKTRFTVVKGPHIDKYGMEQFEMRKYKAVASFQSHSKDEVQWFLDSIKLYSLPGVQVQVTLTGNTYITPTLLTSEPDAHGLASHRKHIQRYLSQPSIAQTEQQQAAQATDRQSADSLRSVFNSLRKILQAGFQDQRQQLGLSQEYKHWHTQNKLVVDKAIRSSQPISSEESSKDALLTSTTDSTEHTGSSRSVPEHLRKASALLAAIEAVFLNLRLNMLDSYKHFPMHFTTYRIGKQQAPAAEWMQAVLQASRAASAVEAAKHGKDFTAALASYSMFAHACLTSLFKVWLQSTSAQMKPGMALPSQAVVNAMLSDKDRRT